MIGGLSSIATSTYGGMKSDTGTNSMGKTYANQFGAMANQFKK